MRLFADDTRRLDCHARGECSPPAQKNLFQVLNGHKGLFAPDDRGGFGIEVEDVLDLVVHMVHLGDPAGVHGGLERAVAGRKDDDALARGGAALEALHRVVDVEGRRGLVVEDDAANAKSGAGRRSANLGATGDERDRGNRGAKH